ncbi:hypothetical protein [Patulibacter minatonensis]|uniref:hypothetical protein n=1 Tax=Patulibacter minatonensis TaxID=298163 RepID=UPI00047EABC7|nr:hypothetical protein [Patulibacter minatonensis]
MARQTKRKTKHRGNAAGMIESRGVTHARSGGRSQSAGGKGAKTDPRLRPPTWRSAFIRALFAAGIFAVVMLVVLKGQPAGVLITTVLLLGVYTPFGYYFDGWMFRRRMAQINGQATAKRKR